MTQRLKLYHNPNSINLEAVACEKYITRFLQKEKLSNTGIPAARPPTYPGTPQKGREKTGKQSTTSINQNQLTKARVNVKQQNIPFPDSNQSSPANDYQYVDDASLVQVTVKTTNPRHRSRSTVVTREPWAQLLKQQKSSDKVSVFSNFDPLRTLHFLAKELQYQLEVTLPDDNNIQQMVTDMQNALKRVPPEIASTIHLQQAIDSLPTRKSSKSLHDEKPEQLQIKTTVAKQQTQTTPKKDQITQTLPFQEECERLQQVMEESTMKLEISCRQMEVLCGQLKKEKENLETQLQAEREIVTVLKKKVEDLEFENTEILNPKMKNLQEEKRKMEAELDELILKMETQSIESATEVKSLINELKNSKAAIEQECSKLKHQLRLSAMEKEKYIAVLAVRDRQINEIQTEMTQLQDVVNDQLLELHNNAFACMPSNVNPAVNQSPAGAVDYNKENMGDTGDVTLSTVHSHGEVDGPAHYLDKPKPFNDVPSGDRGTPIILQDMSENYYRQNTGHLAKDTKPQQYKTQDSPSLMSRPDSQANIRIMFSELRKTAYAIANTQK